MSLGSVLTQHYSSIADQKFTRGIYDFDQNLLIANNCMVTTKTVSFNYFGKIEREIEIAKGLFNSGKYLSAVNTVDNYLFKGFELLAQALNLSIQDKAEIPNVITKLKDDNRIDETIYFSMLDSFLMLDGLLSQVTQGEVLSKQDFDLLESILNLFSGIRIDLVQNFACPVNQIYQVSSNYYGITRASTGNSLCSTNYVSTFSTSSNTFTQSSIVLCM